MIQLFITSPTRIHGTAKRRSAMDILHLSSFVQNIEDLWTNSEKLGRFSCYSNLFNRALWKEALMDCWMAFPITSIHDGPAHNRMRIAVYQAVWHLFDFRWSPDKWFAKVTKSSRVHSVTCGSLQRPFERFYSRHLKTHDCWSAFVSKAACSFWLALFEFVEATRSRHANQGIIVKNGVKSLSRTLGPRRKKEQAIGGWALCSISARRTM